MQAAPVGDDEQAAVRVFTHFLDRVQHGRARVLRDVADDCFGIGLRRQTHRDRRAVKDVHPVACLEIGGRSRDARAAVEQKGLCIQVENVLAAGFGLHAQAGQRAVPVGQHLTDRAVIQLTLGQDRKALDISRRSVRLRSGRRNGRGGQRGRAGQQGGAQQEGGRFVKQFHLVFSSRLTGDFLSVLPI